MKEEVHVKVAPRYIPLPASLWALRRRYPNVTRSILLQCVRCHRWVSQPVLRQPPDEVPTSSTTVTSGGGEIITINNSGVGNSSLASTSTTTTTTTQHSEKGQKGQLSEKEKKEEVEVEWRSPRLCQHYEKVIDAAKLNKYRTHRDEEEEPQESQEECTSYFIPNPANFTCQWVYCALDDVWADLRDQWLGDLYNVMESHKHEEDTSGGNTINSKTQKQRGPQQSQLLSLNEELTKELRGRRSERLAKKTNNRVEIKNEISDTNESNSESAHGNRITQHVNSLIHNDGAVLASFCWISCDSCGKLRRVHQPFPGGAPFVCSLALNIGSCSVPEQDGISPVFRDDGAKDFENEKEENIAGDIALRDVIDAEISANGGIGIGGGGTVSTGRRGARSVTTGGIRQSRHLNSSINSSLPLLRELTSALRKRALGSFVKNVMAIPDEVRAKREEVARASLIVAEGESHRNSTSPKRESGGSGRHENHKSDISNVSPHLQPQQKNKQKQKQPSPSRQSSQQMKRESSMELPSTDALKNNNNNNNNNNGLKKEEVIKETEEVVSKVEIPRRGGRLGCPPRNVPWEIKQCGDDLHPFLKVVVPTESVTQQVESLSSEVASQQESSHHLGSTKIENSKIKLIDKDNSKNSNDYTNGTSIKREMTHVKEPLIEATLSSTTTTIKELNSEDNSLKKKPGRKRTRNLVKDNEDEDDDDDDDDDIYETEDVNNSDLNNKKKKINKKNNDNNEDKNSTTNSRGSGRRGRRPNSETNDAKNNNGDSKENLEIIYWVCCDLCNKWRIVPEKVSSDSEEWVCTMRQDGTTCDDTDDEIRMNRSKRGRKPRGATSKS